MKKICSIVLSTVFLLGMLGLAQAALTSSIQTSGTGFLYGDTTTISVSVANNGPSDVPVDAYLARYAPDGTWTMYSLLQGFVPFDVLTPSSWQTLVANFTLPAGLSIVNVPLLNENFVIGMPAGVYWYFLVLTPGLNTDPLNNIIAFSQTSCSLFATGGQGPTIHQGTISSDETWSVFGNPHIIRGTVKVAGPAPNGATLTIQPGVLVEFEEGAALEIGDSNSPGTLSAVGTGTPGAGIVFTSNQLVNSKGWWQHIKFNDQAVNCRLEFCNIEYGGSTDAWYSGASVVIAGTQDVVVKNCTITNGALSGLRIIDETGLGTIQTNTITGNDGYGIELYADQVRGISGDNQVAGNTLGGVYVLGDKVEHDATWHKLDTPYIVDQVTVSSAAGSVLTLEPGVELAFTQDGYLNIGDDSEPGKLVASGTTSEPITFTSNQGTRTKGWWRHVKFEAEAVESVLDHCIIEYGGSTDAWYSGASVVIAGTQDVVVKNCTITNGALSGLRIIDETGLGTIQTNTITGNDGYGIELYADQVRGISGDNQVAGNTLGGVYVLGDKVEHDATWHKLDTPYIVDQVTVSSAAGSVLTLEPGVELAFTQDGYLNIGDDSEPGKLVASGTTSEPITFTSNQRFKTKGWWRHVKFEAEAVESVLDHCIIEYGGSTDAWYSGANVVVGSSNSIDVKNCEINSGKLHGLKVMDGADPDITGTSFSENDLEDIFIYDNMSTYHGTPVGSPSVKLPD